MPQIQGVLLCSGNGSRFAESVNGQTPYPKHLEMMGEKTVLARTVDSLVENIGVSGITFSLNPQLKDQYILHLRELQREYPDITFTYTLGRADTHEDFEANLQDEMKSACRLDGESVKVRNPLVAIAQGDEIITLEKRDALQSLIGETFSRKFLRERTNLRIGSEFGGMYYHFGYLDHLSSEREVFRRRVGSEFGLRAWNINTREDLTSAARDLGFTSSEGVNKSPEGHPGGEHLEGY